MMTRLLVADPSGSRIKIGPIQVSRVNLSAVMIRSRIKELADEN